MNKSNKLIAALTAVLSVILVIFIKVGCGMISHPIGEKVTQSNNLDAVNTLMAMPFYARLKEVEPQTYDELKEKLTTIAKNGGGNDEMSPVISESSSAISQRRLCRATPETARKYIYFRLDVMKQLYDASPEYMYSTIFQEPISSQIQDKTLKNRIVQMSELGIILFAPESETPIPQDDKLADKLFSEITSSMTPKDLGLIADHSPDSEGGKLTDPVKVRAYCDAYFRMYKKVSALEGNKIVQVLRFLGDIPPDDRLQPK